MVYGVLRVSRRGSQPFAASPSLQEREGEEQDNKGRCQAGPHPFPPEALLFLVAREGRS